MSNYPVAVATPSKCCRHFLCLIVYSKYRKNGVVAIREVVTNPLIYSRWLGIGHTNGRSTVLFALNQYRLITYKCPIPMLHKTKVSPTYDQYVPNAELIEDFFRNCGDSQSINETLWEMFQGSISNPELPTEASQNGQFAYLYKRLTEFFVAIEPSKSPSKSDLNNN